MQDKIALPTIWHVPDDLSIVIEPLLPTRRPAASAGGRQLCFRRVLNGILYVMRTGCQWKAVPREYGSGSSVHRYFQQWTALGCSISVGPSCWSATTISPVSAGNGSPLTEPCSRPRSVASNAAPTPPIAAKAARNAIRLSTSVERRWRSHSMVPTVRTCAC